MYNRIYEGYKPLNPESEEFVLHNQATLQTNNINITNNTEINNKYTELYPQMMFIEDPKYRINANFKTEVEKISTKLAENIKEAIWECQLNKTYTQEAYEKNIERYLINNPKVTVISHGVIQKIDQYGNPWKEWLDDKSMFDKQGLLQQPSLKFDPNRETTYIKYVPLEPQEESKTEETETSSKEKWDKFWTIGGIVLGAVALGVLTVATAGAAGAMAGSIAISYGLSAAASTVATAVTGVGYGIAAVAGIDAINTSVEVATGTNYIAKGLYNTFGNENTTEQDFINGYRNVSDFVQVAGWTYVTFGTYAMGSGYGSQKNEATTSGKVTSKPNQVHHFASDKNSTYSNQFKNITQKYGLDLNGKWNKELLPHQGRHPNAYHDFVLNKMQEIDNIAKGNKDIFLELYESEIKNVIRNNPDMLYTDYWNNLK